VKFVPRGWGLIAAAAVADVCAQTSAPAPDAEPGSGFAPGLLQATFGLAIVLALIWGAAWLIRRLAPMAAKPNSLIKVIATQAVGQRERVVLVEVADQWLLIGVAPGRVTALQNMAKSALPEAPPMLHPFDRLFSLARAKREG